MVNVGGGYGGNSKRIGIMVAGEWKTRKNAWVGYFDRKVDGVQIEILKFRGESEGQTELLYSVSDALTYVKRD